jgi:hypothetical protein
MPYEKNPDELGALWNKMDTKARPYMTGTIAGVDVVIFANTKKDDKQPDWRVLKSKPKPDRVEPPTRLNPWTGIGGSILTEWSRDDDEGVF